MNTIRQTFQNQSAYIAYLTAGDGGEERTLAYAKALIAGGVNMLEIGVPFSDPIADGPIICRAMQRSLHQNTTPFTALKISQALKKEFPHISIILFTYLNPILSVMEKGTENFFSLAKQSGVDGVLIIDLPIEEAQPIYLQMQAFDLFPIHIITPSTPLKRIQEIDQHNKTFLYYACRKGTTGLHNQLPEQFQEQVTQIKAKVKAPIAVGFGISSQQDVKKVLQVADGFIVGSLFIKAIEEGMSVERLEELARGLVLRVGA